MDCMWVETRLESILEGGLSGAERDALAAHVSGCERCAQLLAVLSGSASVSAPEPDEELTAGILARTSGSACDRAGELLAGRMDQELEAEPAHLLGLHLEHCSGCRAVEKALAWMPPVLLDMAELEPDLRFLPEVLDATVRAPRRDWVLGLRRRWAQWTESPRFALQAAYVATLVLTLIFGTPVSPFAELPGQALDSLQGRSDAALVPAVQPIVATYHGGVELGKRLIGSGLGGLRQGVVAIRQDAGRRLEGATPGWDKLSAHGGQLKDVLKKREFERVVPLLMDSRADLGEIWRGLRHQPHQGGDDANAGG